MGNSESRRRGVVGRDAPPSPAAPPRRAPGGDESARSEATHSDRATTTRTNEAARPDPAARRTLGARPTSLGVRPPPATAAPPPVQPPGNNPSAVFDQTVMPRLYEKERRRNPINLRKGSLTIETVTLTAEEGGSRAGEKRLLVTFDFDAMCDGTVRVFFFCKDSHGGHGKLRQSYDLQPTKTSCPPAPPVPLQSGLKQTFRQNPSDGLDVKSLNDSELTFNERGARIHPVAVVLETGGVSAHSEVSQDVRAQATFADLERLPNGQFGLRAVKQSVILCDREFYLYEIYGIESRSTSNVESADETECVICLCPPREIAMLPCRHLCICSSCAERFRRQSNKCPVCRVRVDSMLQISRQHNAAEDGDPSAPPALNDGAGMPMTSAVRDAGS